MSATLYTQEILRLSVETAAVPRLDEPHGSAERRATVCGSRVTVDVSVDEAGRVAAIGLDVRACAMGQAASALLAKGAAGADLERIERVAAALKAFLTQAEAPLPDWPGIAVLAPVKAYPARHGAILIPFEAAEAAIRSALQRQGVDAPPLALGE